MQAWYSMSLPPCHVSTISEINVQVDEGGNL